jgi:ring-1,2-phenylacetyl-CoA epoxidase subunit PaaC
MHSSLYKYILQLGDNALILGHRLSELCGHAPGLETDIALVNISLDLFGQVRNYFQYAAELRDDGSTEDSIAFLRYEHEYLNVELVEQPNTDFAWIIVRQYLFDAYHLPLLNQLIYCKDETIRAIAAKAIKEVSYHHRFSSEWVKRLGDGTEESHQRTQEALNRLWRYSLELLSESDTEKEMKESGIGADLLLLADSYGSDVETVFREAGLLIPQGRWTPSNGKIGMHSEHMGFMLADLQYMQRVYPNMKW